MEYKSTRLYGGRVTAAGAIAAGLAPDGGLFVPTELPQISAEQLRAMFTMNYRDRARCVIEGFLPEFSAGEVRSLTENAYGNNFDAAEIAPTRLVGGDAGFLELWHGPTCAFKDMALQMLPHLLTASLKKSGEERGVCILVATSGDTGKAALQGFADVPGTRILVFYPRDGVSDVQRLQMTTQSGKNVGVCAVEGNFDDAQTGVKAIFGDSDLAERLSHHGWFLSSANSINWGRLLPQIAYYFSAYCDMVNAGVLKTGDKLNFSVPTGNFGDILAGWYAAGMGLPVGRLICASNANSVLTDFINTGVYNKNRPFYVTSSPSMDILVSSNLERLLYHLCGSGEQVAGYMDELKKTGSYTASPEIMAALNERFYASCCDEEQTSRAIGEMWREKGYLMDPHTAVGWKALCDYRRATGDDLPAVVVSTASPFKFCDSVLEALGVKADAPGAELIGRLSLETGIDAPAPLKGLENREVRFTDCVSREDMPVFSEAFAGAM